MWAIPLEARVRTTVLIVIVMLVVGPAATSFAVPPVPTIDVSQSDFRARLASKFGVTTLEPIPVLATASIGPLSFDTANAPLLCHLVGARTWGTVKSVSAKAREVYVVGLGAPATRADGSQSIAGWVLVGRDLHAQLPTGVVAMHDFPGEVAGRIAKNGSYHRAVLMKLTLPVGAEITRLDSLHCEW